MTQKLWLLAGACAILAAGCTDLAGAGAMNRAGVFFAAEADQPPQPAPDEEELNPPGQPEPPPPPPEPQPQPYAPYPSYNPYAQPNPYQPQNPYPYGQQAPYPYQRYYGGQGSPFSSGWYTIIRGSAGIVVPEARTLDIGGSVDLGIEMALGFYSVGVSVGYYSLNDDDLGGRVNVVPIRVGAKIWTDDPGLMMPRAYAGLALGPYLLDHTRSDVIYDSTIGLDLVAGVEMYPASSWAIGADVGYTINQPGITIGGIPGDENLNAFFFRISVGGAF